MRKTIFILILLSLSSIISAQENKLLDELNEVKSAEEQVSYVLNLQVENLEKIALTIKLDSDLNTIASCIMPFVNSKTLKLTEKETADLKKRTEIIATELFNSDNFVLLKNSGGYAPVYGVGIENIADKKVVIVHLGGDCTIDEVDLKWEEITSVFNNKMESLLKE